ncbi:sensor histidine kinase [Larkinella soli]|uniref:sensor histidine kinase n=1 Tax=Larkinella soli TaxID=1770527 RepID=UPI001E49EB15|nr:ATP-binding protein [Larkinella soli]
MVNIVLRSKFPMVLFWGPEYIQFYNDAYRPSLGQEGKHPNALGKAGPACWPEIWYTFAQPLFDQIRRSGESVFSEDQLVPIYRNGREEEAYWTYTYLPVLDEAGEVGGILAIVHETTQKVVTAQHLQQRTEELATANADLLRSNQNLQQFAYVASHDLQEPLRKIQAFSTLLSEQFKDQLNESARDYLNRITGASARMSSLIRDLLVYSRASIRQQAFEPLSLGAVVAGVLDNLSLDIEQRKARIILDELPQINGDKSQLAQLFQNLISNAVKFTPVHQVPLIQIRYDQRKPGELPPEIRPNRSVPFYHQISISDQGVGFDMRFRDRIFQVFHRLHSQNEFPGTGVGLAICRQVVENHGGGITAYSNPGEGATFVIYLPG